MYLHQIRITLLLNKLQASAKSVGNTGGVEGF